MLIPYFFGEVTYDGSGEFDGKECRRICVFDTNSQTYTVCETKDYLKQLFSGVDPNKGQLLENAKIIYGIEEASFETIGLFKDETTVFYDLGKSVDCNGSVTGTIKAEHKQQMMDDAAYCYIDLTMQQEEEELEEKEPEKFYISCNYGDYRMNWMFQYPFNKDSGQNIVLYKIGQQILFYRDDGKRTIRFFLEEKVVTSRKTGKKKSIPWITVKVKRSYREKMTVSWILGESMPENSLLTEVRKCSDDLAEDLADAIVNLPFKEDLKEIIMRTTTDVKEMAAEKLKEIDVSLFRWLLLG